MRPVLFTRARTLVLVLWLGLAALALEPVAPLERALDLLFLPTRALPELAAPLEWIGAREVRAAERRLARDAALARARAEALFRDEQDAALPTRAELALGRRFVHGEVVRRGANDLDSVIVRLATRAGVEPGMPVVAGDHYVGRVTRVASEGAAEATVLLVTGSDFFVGAEVLDGAARAAATTPVMLVAGGLAPRVERGRGSDELAVHNPSRKPAAGGEVLVREALFPETERASASGSADRWSELATGFRLGELETLALEGGGELHRIRPGLDYQGGLFQVLVAAPAGGGPLEERLELDSFDAAGWVALAALPGAELDPARCGRRYALAFGHGLARGAALALGGHLVGRIERVDWLSADARLLGDPGLSLAALARVEGEERPFALGEIVAVGRRRADGAALFRWDARVALGGEGAPAQAELFTGSGIEGVPRGLYLGTAELPRTPGRHVIALHPAPEARAVKSCLAWRGLARDGAEEQP